MRVSSEQRINLFSMELSWIQNSALRSMVEIVLRELPDYFFHVPASSSGKYHPAYTLGEGGLVRHTKAAVHILKHLFDADVDLYYMNMDSENPELYTKEQFDDECLAAMILHDSMKWGKQEVEEGQNDRHTLFEHPILSAMNLMETAERYEYRDMAQINRIASMISTHMGRWTVSRYSTQVLPSPDLGSWGNKLVHIADYMASRKDIEFKFGQAEIPMEE